VLDAAARPVRDPEYPFVAITYKDILGGQSRTLPTDYWLSAIEPENVVWMNATRAQELGLRDGQVVRLVSASNPEGRWHLGTGKSKDVAGKLKLTEGIRPDVVAVSWHYGHWAYGSTDVEIDGRRIPGDPRRATGLCSNAVLRVDPYLGDVCLTDPVGGSSSFYDTRVKVLAASL
jgi:anaerobic selenocysteine-containing dehydrogenase